MRTLLGWGRWAQLLFRRGKGSGAVAKVPAVRPLAGGRAPLINDRLGLQTRGGAKLDQVDGTTCGSAVLVALAAWADPTETRRLDGESPGVAAVGSSGIAVGFGGRYDTRQRQVHRESTKFWPQALGTSPWGMAAWLRGHAPGAGPYRVRMVDDRNPADLTAVVEATNAALAVGRPVPLLVGAFVPRHYCLALSGDADAWHVYEPTSGEVRRVPLDQVRRSALVDPLGFDRLSAVLLPS
jgi:hypothetical protein